MDLSRTFDVDNGFSTGKVIVLDTIIGKTDSQKPTYTGDLITKLEFYSSATQIDSNRLAKLDITYDSNDKVTQEDWDIYDTDGTTVIQEVQIVYTYSGDNVTKVEETVT